MFLTLVLPVTGSSIVQDEEGSLHWVNPQSDYPDRASEEAQPRPGEGGIRKQSVTVARLQDATIKETEETTITDSLSRRTVVLRDSAGQHIRVEMEVRHAGTPNEAIVSEAAMSAECVLVRLRPGYREVDLKQFLAARSDVVFRARISRRGIFTLTLTEFSIRNFDQVMESLLNADWIIEQVSPDHLYFAEDTIPDDAEFGTMWGLSNTGQFGQNDDTSATLPNWDTLTSEAGWVGADINAVEAWDYQTGAPNVIVAVIDTGVNYNHEDLNENMWVNPGEIPGNGIDDDLNGYVDDIHGMRALDNGATRTGDPADNHGHGTHVAGTIGAEGNNDQGIAGVAWDVQIMACKFLNPSGYASDAISCIEYAVDHGAVILNNSWGGGGFSSNLRNAIADARDAGVLFVAAAGNAGIDNDTVPHYPSSYSVEDYPTIGDWDNIIAVAASDRRDRLAWSTDEMLEVGDSGKGSHYGATSVDLAAPGVEILSCKYNNPWWNPGWYVRLSGTSMATPHVSGILAMIAARFTADTPLQLKQRLFNSVDRRSDLIGDMVTEGRADLNRSLSVFSAHPPSSLVFFQREVDWFGYIDDEDYPEIWHSTLGTLGLDAADTAESYIEMYIEIMGAWVVTGNTDYPWFYRWSDGAWLYYDGNPQPPNFTRWFYNTSTGQWEGY